MANITELQLQGSSTVHKLNDARITTTAVTTATHILTTNSGVTSIAPITIANLASDLGVTNAKIDSGGDCNTAFQAKQGIHLRYITGNISNAPYSSSQSGYLIMITLFMGISDIWQLACDIVRGRMWFRNKSSSTTWDSWKQISTVN